VNHYPQAPLSVGKVLDAGFSMYRHILKPALPLAIALGIVSQVPQVLPYMIAGGHAPGLVTVLGLLAWFVLYLALYNGWIVSADGMARGEAPLGFGAAFGAGLGKVPGTLLAVVLFMVALCIGLVLLVIPGLILMVTLFFFWYFILLENQGAVASLKSSHALVWGGNFWRTTAVVTVAAVIYLVALFAIGGTLGLLIGVSMFDDPTPEELAAGPGMALLVFATVQVVLNAVLLPMWTSLTLVLYRDLQLRRAAAA
jgi:hypothetical protein